jgi:hypothetical protein
MTKSVTPINSHTSAPIKDRICISGRAAQRFHRVSQREKTSFPADHQDLNSGALVIFIPENVAHH